MSELGSWTPEQLAVINELNGNKGEKKEKPTEGGWSSEQLSAIQESRQPIDKSNYPAAGYAEQQQQVDQNAPDWYKSISPYMARNPYAEPRTNPESPEYGGGNPTGTALGAIASPIATKALDVAMHPASLVGGGTLAAGVGLYNNLFGSGDILRNILGTQVGKGAEAAKMAEAFGRQVHPIGTQAAAKPGMMSMLGNLGAAMAPAVTMAAPYMAANAKREEIEANPNAPGLQFNPYAQEVRSRYTAKPITAGQAGEANRRKAAYDAAERILSRGL